MPETFVFEMQNLYIPEGEEYVSEEFPIRIEPVEGIDEFEEERREIGSEYQTGYYFTANCYIEAEEDRAEELADWIMQLYSFFQLRDVRWNTRYREEAPEQKRWRRTFPLPLDNSGPRLILGVTDNGPGISGDIGTMVDTALRTVDEADKRLEDEIKRSLSLFLEAEGNNSYPLIQFLFLWIVLESNAKRYYDRYVKSQRDFLFDDEEQDCVRDYVFEEFKGKLDSEQLNHLYDNLDRNYFYERSSADKIVEYIEYLNLGFDMDEVGEIVGEGREIRNRIVHSMDDTQIFDNIGIETQLRKIVIFVMLRELGLDMQNLDTLSMPMLPGPTSRYEPGHGKK